MTLVGFVFCALATTIACYGLGHVLCPSQAKALGPSLEDRFQAALAEGLLTEEDLKEIGIRS